MSSFIYQSPQHYQRPQAQQGAALFTGIIILLVFSMALISGSNTVVLQQKMANNSHEKVKTLQAADSTASVAMQDLAFMNLAMKSGSAGAKGAAGNYQAFSPAQPVEGTKIEYSKEPSVEMVHTVSLPAPGWSIGTAEAQHFFAKTRVELNEGSATDLTTGFFRIAPQSMTQRK